MPFFTSKGKGGSINGEKKDMFIFYEESFFVVFVVVHDNAVCMGTGCTTVYD